LAEEAPNSCSRAADEAVVVYGRNPVRELLRGARGASVERVWATRATAREPWLGGDTRLALVAAPELERLCGSGAHQGVCARAGPYPYRDAADLLGDEDALVVALDGVQDPQNLGAICRTAECAGASGVVIPERRAAQVTPAVCKASAGAVEHLAIARVRNLADFLAAAKDRGAWCYGADAGAPEDCAGPDYAAPDYARPDYAAPDYAGRVVLVLGAEGRGLGRRVAAACDALVAIPVRGRIGSLNVSAAAAVLLYGALDSRRRAASRA
jgi:23S rRNA (guanosine2251-2'-O)-methyltransferase